MHFVTVLLMAGLLAGQQAAAKRPMTFVDVVSMRSVGDTSISPDGKLMLYTLIYLVTLDRGVSSGRQMTATKLKNESSPRWSRDSRFFLFLSNREAPASAQNQNQLYMMRPDGGEARRITDAKDGAGNFAVSKDGKWIAFTAGKEDERQLWTIAVSEIESPAAKQLTKHETPVVSFLFSPDGKAIYFLSPDSLDKDDRERRDKKFDVRVRNQDVPPNHLWAIDLESQMEKRLSSGDSYSVADVSISDDSRWIGFRGVKQDRYVRTITEAETYADLYLLNVASGATERLTNNEDIQESALRFSPDSAMLAFAADDDFQFFRNNRVYVRAVKDAGGRFRKLGSDFDGDLNVNFWSKDGRTIYSNSGVRATTQLLAISLETGKVTQVTKEQAALTVSQDSDTGTILVNYADPSKPRNVYTVAQLANLGDRSTWKQLTDANPQVLGFELGETEAIQWKSTDGKMVEGVLVKPAGYERGKRYPLIVQIHGGPASADVQTFHSSPTNYPSVYAAAGYFVLMPNYRGSSNYGERFKMEIAEHYFNQGYNDIMSGVDHLIGQGMVDPDKMGVMGWSAGGHWSNWILTHTNRFKAVSTGAGAMNWTSMYAETDVQRIREYYFRGKPYDNFEYLWDISPLKYIKNARTPTLIHVVDGDPRVPRPQSEELHMGLKKLGVPTEFFVYPGATHGIPDARNQVVKMMAEFNWFEKWVKGKDEWFTWKDLLNTLKDEKK
ncbi:MAG: S9 family peptidase [Acidobacteria bacterium]|nr:S9 family peptidase [Acidobacteriota bacterium]